MAAKALVLESNRMASSQQAEDKTGIAFSKSWILNQAASLSTRLLPFAVMAPSALMQRLVSDAVHHPGRLKDARFPGALVFRV